MKQMKLTLEQDDYCFLTCPKCSRIHLLHGGTIAETGQAVVDTSKEKCSKCNRKLQLFIPNSGSSSDPQFHIFRGNPINRELILHEIGDHFQSLIQWARGTVDNAARWQTYMAKAEALIEILEVDDCGSVKGHDQDQPRARDLFDRWDWLFRKYHNPEGRKFGCAIISYEEIKEWFEARRDGV